LKTAAATPKLFIAGPDLRMAHALPLHPGPFDFCVRCGGLEWAPDRDFGIAVYHAGKLVEEVQADPTAPGSLGSLSVLR